MKTTLVTSKQELLPRRESILALFAASYGSALPGAVWDWAYVDNPNGEPGVALCEEGDELVGHYAMIPMPVRRRGETMNAFLSMTTMVAPSHRGLGLFVTLASAAYEAATALGIDCVLGFPNAQSAPGFRKHLGWNLPAPDRLITLGKRDLMILARQQPLFGGDRFGIDLGVESMRRWRLARPGAGYQQGDGLVLKPFGDGIDLVYCESVDSLDALPDDQRINLLVPGDCPVPAGTPAADYQFGGAPLARAFDPAIISRCMLLSDVF